MKELLCKIASPFLTFPNCNPLKKGILTSLDWIISSIAGILISLRMGIVQVVPKSFGVDEIDPDTLEFLQTIGVIVVIVWGLMRGWNEYEKAMMKREERKRKYRRKRR